jgi:hypothetical protein
MSMSDNKKFPPSGALFAVRSDNPKAPDYSGPLEISTDLLKVLLDQANAGEPVKMQLTAYKNTHPERGEWIKLTAVKYEPYTGGKNGKSRSIKDDPF